MNYFLLFSLWSAGALGRQCGTSSRRPLASWKFSTTRSLSTGRYDTSAIETLLTSSDYDPPPVSSSTWAESQSLTSVSELTGLLESTTASGPLSLPSIYSSKTISPPEDNTETASVSTNLGSSTETAWRSESAQPSGSTSLPPGGVSQRTSRATGLPDDPSTAKTSTILSGDSSGSLLRSSSWPQPTVHLSGSISSYWLPSIPTGSSTQVTDPASNPIQTASSGRDSIATSTPPNEFTSATPTDVVNPSEAITQSRSPSTREAPTSEYIPISQLSSTSIPQLTSEVTLPEPSTIASGIDNESDTSTASEVKSEAIPPDSTHTDESIGSSTLGTATPPQSPTTLSDASSFYETTEGVNPTGSTTSVDGVESSEFHSVPPLQTTTDSMTTVIPSEAVPTELETSSDPSSTVISDVVPSTVEITGTVTDTDEVPVTHASTDEVPQTTETANTATVTDEILTSQSSAEDDPTSEYNTSKVPPTTKTAEISTTTDEVPTSQPNTDEVTPTPEITNTVTGTERVQTSQLNTDQVPPTTGIPSTDTRIDEDSTSQPNTDEVMTSEAVPETTSIPTAVGPPPSSQPDPQSESTLVPDSTENPGVPSKTAIPSTYITGTDIPTSPTTPDITATQTGESELSITSTMTEPPTDFFHTTVSNHPEWTTNTWITTTSPGSSDATIVPVLIGCPICGGPGVGIVLFGFPKIIRTLFHFPGLPKFSFPCIPVLSSCSTPPKTHPDDGGDGDDDGDDDDHKTSEIESSTAASTCTVEMTASDCVVACTTYTGPSEASAAPECSTTCYSTYTGCSVTGITSTTSTEACSATGGAACLTCRKPLDDDDQPDDDDDQPDDDDDQPDDNEIPSIKRANFKRTQIEGTAILRSGIVRRTGSLEKRGNPEALKWKGCTLTRPPVIPGFIPGGALLTGQVAGTLSAAHLMIHKWLIYENSGPPLCFHTLSDIPVVPAYKIAEDIDSTVDHAYEKKWLTAFLRQIVDPSVDTVQGLSDGERMKINCDDLKYYIDDAPDSNLLDDVTNQFPSDTQFTDDLIGMEQWVNSDAKVWSSNTTYCETRLRLSVIFRGKQLHPSNMRNKSARSEGLNRLTNTPDGLLYKKKWIVGSGCFKNSGLV